MSKVNQQTTIPLEERVFCNRSLNMGSVKALGFDMDYTLALYQANSFEALVYEETLKKMVAAGYPKEILDWSFDYSSMIRGLVIDKHRGNILKLDRHNYIKVAYHGFKELDHSERKKLYDLDTVIEYREPNFAFLDTYFAITEGFLVSKLVEYKDAHSDVLREKSYFDFYVDVRKYLDLSHRDDSLKQTVAKNPEKYLTRDALLPEVLQTFHQEGKKLFILTNSLWNYVNPIMHYLLPPNEAQGYKSWTDYFDCIITGAQKPQFFSSKNLMYEVDATHGFLKNLPFESASVTQKNLKFFQGGHVQPLHQILSVSKGSEIVYVGDHIYGDIVRSKKDVGWRTLLVIDELTKELQDTYHPIWGAVMKAGKNNAFFSAQMSHYACLYTSKFTNLRHYHPGSEIFESIPDRLPHEYDPT